MMCWIEAIHKHDAESFLNNEKSLIRISPNQVFKDHTHTADEVVAHLTHILIGIKSEHESGLSPVFLLINYLIEKIFRLFTEFLLLFIVIELLDHNSVREAEIFNNFTSFEIVTIGVALEARVGEQAFWWKSGLVGFDIFQRYLVYANDEKLFEIPRTSEAFSLGKVQVTIKALSNYFLKLLSVANRLTHVRILCRIE